MVVTIKEEPGRATLRQAIDFGVKVKEGRRKMRAEELLTQVWDEFTQDAGLVHGGKSIEDSFVPPAEVGVYSIRLPKELISEEQRANTKAVLVSCMDKRVVRNLYQQLLNQGYKENEIMTISMGGGAVHTRERMKLMRLLLGYVLGPEGVNEKVVEKIVVSGHDGVCGAAKFYGGGERPLHEVVGMDEEGLMEGLIVGGFEDLVAEPWRAKAEVGLAHIDGETGKVSLGPIDMVIVKPLRVGEVLAK